VAEIGKLGRGRGRLIMGRHGDVWGRYQPAPPVTSSSCRGAEIMQIQQLFLSPSRFVRPSGPSRRPCQPFRSCARSSPSFGSSRHRLVMHLENCLLVDWVPDLFLRNDSIRRRNECLSDFGPRCPYVGRLRIGHHRKREATLASVNCRCAGAVRCHDGAALQTGAHTRG